MSQDKLEIQFVLFAMLRIDYKCISQLMLIQLAVCVVPMRKERSEGAVLVVYAVLFVIIFIYLAATPQAAGIWLMIIRVHIRSLSHPESFSHCLWSSARPPPLYSLHFQRALPNQIPVRSFKLAYNPKVKMYFPFFACSYFSFQLRREAARGGGVVDVLFVMLIPYPSGIWYSSLIVIPVYIKVSQQVHWCWEGTRHTLRDFQGRNMLCLPSPPPPPPHLTWQNYPRTRQSRWLRLSIHCQREEKKNLRMLL